MAKPLHKIDTIFKEAQSQFEETPPEGMWEKLSAGLDKHDIEKYKKRFRGWKRLAILLSFLFSSYVIYQMAFNKKPEPIQPGNTESVSTQSNTTTDHNKTQAANGTQTKSDAITDNLNHAPTETENKIMIEEKNNNKLNSVSLKNTNEPTPEKSVLKNSSSATNFVAEAKKVAPNKQRHIANKNLIERNQPQQYEPAPKNIITENTTTIGPPKSSFTLYPHLAVPNYTLQNFLKVPEITSTTIAATPFWVNHAQLVLPKEKSTPKHNSYWAISPVFLKVWKSYRIQNGDVPAPATNPDEKDDIDNQEKEISSFSVGAYISRQFAGRLGIESGVFFSHTTLEVAPQYIYASRQNNGTTDYVYKTSSGYTYINPGFGVPPATGDSLHTDESSLDNYIISIPLALSYRIQKNKWTITPAVGATANFQISNKITTEVTDSYNNETVTISKLNGAKPFYAGLIINANLQYAISNRFSVSLWPVFKYALTPTTEKYVISTYPYSFGIGGGITLKF